MSATNRVARGGRCTRHRDGFQPWTASARKINHRLVLLSVAIGCIKTVRAGDDRFGFATHFEQGWAPNPVMQDIASTGVSYIRDDLNSGDWEPKLCVYVQPAGHMALLNDQEANSPEVPGDLG